MTLLQKAPTYEAAPALKTADGLRSGPYSLLGMARASSSARYARGLRSLMATVSRGVLELETAGRSRTQSERAALLDFAEAYLGMKP